MYMGLRLALAFGLVCAHAKVHHLKIHMDTRRSFHIETFGFFPGGHMNITLRNLKITDRAGAVLGKQIGVPSANWSTMTGPGMGGSFRVGLLMRRSETESTGRQEDSLDFACLFERKAPTDIIISAPTWQLIYDVPAGREGLYNLFFANCASAGTRASFDLHYEQYNPGPNYLSAGDVQLPRVYFGMSAAYAVLLVAWLGLLLNSATENVHSIHYLMGVLLVLKTLSLLFEGIKFWQLAAAGKVDGGWNFLFYAFQSARGVMLFLVLLLIGTGFGLLRPYLTDRDKRIVLVVLPLQIFTNVAMIMFDESEAGSQAWLSWRDILHMADILCCAAILFPIVWSIKHLREQQGGDTDGKAARNAGKLALFRTFYVMVVSYVYFTRIVVFLLGGTLPYQLIWAREFITECATAMFYLVTGLKFRPTVDNPYLSVPETELEELDSQLDSQLDEDIVRN